MYNLLLPDLCATLLGALLSLESTGGITLTLYCVVPYMAACVVISGTVFWDCSVLRLPVKALILVAKLWKLV